MARAVVCDPGTDMCQEAVDALELLFNAAQDICQVPCVVCFVDPELIALILSNVDLFVEEEILFASAEEAGETIGVEMVGFDPGEFSTEIAGMLGFQDGDVLLSVDGLKLRTTEEIGLALDQLAEEMVALIKL